MSEKEILKVVDDLRIYAENGHFFIFGISGVAPSSDINKKKWHETHLRPIMVTLNKVIDYVTAPDNEKGERLRAELRRNWRGSVTGGRARAYQYMLWSMVGCDLGKRADQISSQRRLLEETKYSNPVLSRYVDKCELETAEVSWKRAGRLNDTVLDSIEQELREGFIVIGERHENTKPKGFSLFKRLNFGKSKAY